MGSELAPHIAVIGGGCAGLSAAAKLAQHGLQVSLLEASPHLGGRARGLNWQGKRLDNGQHILLGAYRETLALIELAGVDLNRAIQRIPLQIEMHGDFSLKACAKLPAPLHILAGLLQAQGLTWPERYAAIRFMAKLKLQDFQLTYDVTLSELLSSARQPEKLVKMLWEPLCLAALNTPLHSASAQVFMNVLRDSFAHAKSDSDMLLPRVDLTALLAQPLADCIERMGGNIHLGNAVNHIKPLSSGFELSAERTGEMLFSHVVIASSPFRAAALMDDIPSLTATKSCIAQLDYQPIYTIYLQYPETIRLHTPMLGFAQGYSQWIFDRGLLCGDHGLMAVIISADGAHQKLTQQHLAEAVMAEISRAFPAWPAPLWHKVIAEKRATFACTAGLKRPAHNTAIRDLYLAGDYVAGDYPATIEGAVRNGKQCADSIINSLKG